MRYAIFSDIHSNQEAFQEAVSFFHKEKVDKFIFLGDIVGYGANPKEVIVALRKLNSYNIAGNHDWAVGGRLSLDIFNTYAREALIWTKEHLREEDINYLNNLPLLYEEPDFICVHSSLFYPEKFYYILSLRDAFNNFFYQNKSICFIGHTHCQESYILKEDRVLYYQGEHLYLEKDKKYIINVGSVGQPRDNNWYGGFCIYDSEKKIVFWRRFSYNIKKAAEKIEKEGLPLFLSQRLFRGC